LVPDILEGQSRVLKAWMIAYFPTKFEPKYGSWDWRPGPGKLFKDVKTCPHCDVTNRKPQTQFKLVFFNRN